MMDLATTYMGLRLRSPLVASASPLTAGIGNIVKLEGYGAGAVVLPSIFQEQIEAERDELELRTSVGRESSPEALGYFPNPEAYAVGTRRYLELIRRARAAVGIPIIASLNGTTSEGWIEFAKEIEAAGAHGLELNVYFIPADLALSGPDVERRYLEIVHAVRGAVRLPLAVKLSPFFSSTGAFARRLQEAGADALVLFNRFYQPDIDLEHLSLHNDLELSSRREIRLPLLWIGILAGRLNVSLAATTGVETSEEAAKYLLAGADVVMTTSALLRRGVEHMEALVTGLEAWMQERHFTSLAQVRGLLSQERIADPSAFERANYIQVLQSYGAGVRRNEPRNAGTPFVSGV
jgi:dihydroorotate dehydrogenase (fumarate)